MSTTPADLQKLLTAGENLPLQEYLNLFNKVKDGGSLSARENERYKKLHAELSAKSKPAFTQTTAAPESFKNAREIMEYLTASGRHWKVSHRVIYDHIKAHKLKARPNGTFTLTEVERYALANLRKADGTVPQEQFTAADKVAVETTDHRLRREKAQADILELKFKTLEGELVPRDAFENGLAARAAIFRSDLETLFRAKSPEIIALVAGDAIKTPDLIAWGIEAVETIVARYLSKEEFKVDMTAYEKIFSAADKDKDEEETDFVER